MIHRPSFTRWRIVAPGRHVGPVHRQATDDDQDQFDRRDRQVRHRMKQRRNRVRLRRRPFGEIPADVEVADQQQHDRRRLDEHQQRVAPPDRLARIHARRRAGRRHPARAGRWRRGFQSAGLMVHFVFVRGSARGVRATRTDGRSPACSARRADRAASSAVQNQPNSTSVDQRRQTTAYHGIEDAAEHQRRRDAHRQQERPDRFAGQVVAMVGRGIERGGDQHLPLLAAQARDDRRIRRVLPERLAALHGRRIQEVVVRRRRSGRPFQRAGLPRIVARQLARAGGSRAR